MRTKWLLIALPLAILALLLQSSLWVPTFASQAKGNPGRLVTFIRGAIGDAKYPNPVLISDKGTSDVVDKTVFEMLLDSDENMKLTPLLAKSWGTTEEAYVAARTDRKLPDGAAATASALAAAIESARKAGEPSGALASVQSVETVGGETRSTSTSVLRRNAAGKDEPVDVELSIDVPERVKLTLSKVEPHLFKELEAALGKGYFDDYPFASRFKLVKPELLEAVRPKFAELLGVGEHNPIITFHLQSGVKWHDGQPFTAQDVQFTYQAAVDPKNASPRAGSFDTIKSVDIVDEHTVRVVYKVLYAEAIIDWAGMGIIPKHLLNDAALAREMDRRKLSADERKTFSLRTTDFNLHPVGTGPFRFAEWLPNQYIRITRNEDYWRQKPEYKDVFFRVLPDYLAMEVEFGAGALDMYEALPHQAERYRHDSSYQVVANKEGWYTYIGYNMRREPFQDIRVRRALGMAIDVDSLIKYVLSGEGSRATGPYYANTPYNDPAVKPLPYDPKAAVALLEEAGWRKNAKGIFEKNGKPLAFTLVTNAGNLQRKATMTIAEEAWRKIGVDCKVQAFEWTVLLEDFVNKLNFDALVFGWVGADTTPDRYQIWHSSQTDPYELNFVGYKSPKADALIETIRETYDEAEQVRLARELHRTIAADQPYTFLYEPSQPRVLDKRIAIVEKDASGREKLEKITTPPSGDVMYLFNRWRKQSHAPELAP
ncbi:MAG TPA: ABC transporter substrate-binding protein [Polyangiaceae bacterium]|nr:ABC transporter substrate-binding protein [Polyangiaceae bacterium]